MNNPKSLFTRTIGLIALLMVATFSHFSANAQTRVPSRQSAKMDKIEAEPVNNNTWYFEGLKMSPSDERAFLSLLRQIDPNAYSVQEVSQGKAVRTYGKSSPAQVQLVRKTITQQGTARAKGGIFRHKVHTDDKFSESTFIWLKTPGLNADIVSKIDKLMAKYQGPNVVNVKQVQPAQMSIRQK